MFEAGTAVVRGANGEQLLVQFATRYFGMDSGLSAPQFGVAEFDATFDGRTLTMGWDGHFEGVAPVPASLTALLAAGLLAPPSLVVRGPTVDHGADDRVIGAVVSTWPRRRRWP